MHTAAFVDSTPQLLLITLGITFGTYIHRFCITPGKATVTRRIYMCNVEDRKMAPAPDADHRVWLTTLKPGDRVEVPYTSAREDIKLMTVYENDGAWIRLLPDGFSREIDNTILVNAVSGVLHYAPVQIVPLGTMNGKMVDPQSPTAGARFAIGGSREGSRMARPEDHAKGFDVCAKGLFSQRQALVMARGFAAKGLTDMSEGCTHFALRLIVLGADASSDAAPQSQIKPVAANG
jgi:hypothetical protein